MLEYNYASGMSESLPANLPELTISQAAESIARKELSPVELTHACLERINDIDPLVNSFITVTAELALEQARQAEEQILHNESHGPLHGIPLALKDLYETRGIRTTAGSKFFTDHLPDEDAVAVLKLRQAGAVLLGKLNLHEIALGVTNENPHFGTCRNPWDLKRITGGSSGGSAAALIAGLCMGSLGSDTGGSIRIPASLCSVVGLKPTYGRVSLRGIIPLSWNLDHAGPLARSVRDAAILLQAIAGYDAQDASSVDVPVDDYLSSLEMGVRGWRIALASDEFFQDVEEPVWQAFQEAGRAFSSLGAQVEEVEVPGFRQAAQANGLMVTSDAAAFHRERLNSRPGDFGVDVLERLRLGAAATSTEYALARRTQALMRRQFERFFETYDLLLTPTTPCAASLLQEHASPMEVGPVQRARQLTRFTAPFNLTGLPAISVPCGFIRVEQMSSSTRPEKEEAVDLPVGLQIVAYPWGEARLLRAARAYEEASAWHLRRPAWLR